MAPLLRSRTVYVNVTKAYQGVAAIFAVLDSKKSIRNRAKSGEPLTIPDNADPVTGAVLRVPPFESFGADDTSVEVTEECAFSIRTLVVGDIRHAIGNLER